MEISKCKYSMRCEADGCNKLAVYCIRLKRTVLRNALNICEDCLKELYEETGKLFVPKSVKSPLKKKKDGSVSEKELKKEGLELPQEKEGR